MTTDLTEFGDEAGGFESLARSNGNTWWYASDLARMLGYASTKPFFKAIQNGMTTCATLDISIQDNFREEECEVDGKVEKDYKLTRFACYLATMNADVSKPRVAHAQAYFALIAETFRQHFQDAGNVERILIRENVSMHEKSLTAEAKHAGVENYAFFQNAGYRGMYNMHLSQLKAYKGHTGNKPLLDFMGSEEMAANLFRLTQTEAKIRNEKITGQQKLEDAAYHSGAVVRQTMQKISGNNPEDLLLAEDISKVRGGVKKTRKEFEKMDQKTIGNSTKPSRKKSS